MTRFELEKQLVVIYYIQRKGGEIKNLLLTFRQLKIIKLFQHLSSKESIQIKESLILSVMIIKMSRTRLKMFIWVLLGQLRLGILSFNN